MNTELKQLIEDAAKLLGLVRQSATDNDTLFQRIDGTSGIVVFNPLDPERGDLMKVAEAAELGIDYEFHCVHVPVCNTAFEIDEYEFTKGDYQSLALAVLRAASAVLKARGE